MMNTIFSSFAAKGNTNITRPIFDKYYKYFVALGYTEEDSSLIADLFQTSANKGLDVLVREYITKLESKGSLILRCLGPVELFIRPFGGNETQRICPLSLDMAIRLADANVAGWEHTSRHFLEQYNLAQFLLGRDEVTLSLPEKPY